MSETCPNLLKAINEVMKAVTHVGKTGHNSFHNYKYASDVDILDALRPHLIEHGIVLIPSTDEGSHMDDYGNTTIRVSYTIGHISGELWPTPIVVEGCGNDRDKKGNVGDKGVYKAYTGANKYALTLLFQLPRGNDPEIPNRMETGEASEHEPPDKDETSGVDFAEANKRLRQAVETHAPEYSIEEVRQRVAGIYGQGNYNNVEPDTIASVAADIEDGNIESVIGAPVET